MDIISIPLGKAKDLTNKRFGKLVAISRAPNKSKFVMWNCKCDCGNIIVAYAVSLNNGDIKKCNQCSYNRFIIVDGYFIGKTTKGKEFYFDLVDYDLLNKHTWYIDKDGYVVTFEGKKIIQMHRLIMEQIENIDDYDIDHINLEKHNNRRNNLRKATRQENKRNVLTSKNNTTGCKGVYKIKYSGIDTGRYYARIRISPEDLLHLGCFSNYEDAVKARHEAELKYFGEFSPLFNKK